VKYLVATYVKFRGEGIASIYYGSNFFLISNHHKPLKYFKKYRTIYCDEKFQRPPLKGTVSRILSDLSFQERHPHFAMVPFKPLTDQG